MTKKSPEKFLSLKTNLKKLSALSIVRKSSSKSLSSIKLNIEVDIAKKMNLAVKVSKSKETAEGTPEAMKWQKGLCQFKKRKNRLKNQFKENLFDRQENSTVSLVTTGPIQINLIDLKSYHLP